MTTARTFVMGLLAFDLLMPVAIVIVLGAARLLGAMGDGVGRAVMIRIGEAAGMLWLIGLVLLLIAVAADRVMGSGNDE